MSAHLPGKFVWFEHASQEPARAQAFYEALFGWRVESMPMGGETYLMILNGAQGIGGLRGAEPGARPHWASYVSVPDVDAAHAAALAAGARSLQAPTDFGAVGRAAAIADPTGAAVCLWKGAEGDRADAERIADGDWYWNELWTPDDRAALAFYERLLGYGHDAMDMGPMGTYHLLKSADGKMRAGVMRSQKPGALAMWLPYVRVADADAEAARAAGLGAEVVVSPTDIPGVGRFAVLVDPTGAAVAIIKPLQG